MKGEIVISDANFEQEIRRQLGLYDRPITEEDTLQITKLDCSDFDFLEDAGILRFFPKLVSLALVAHVNFLPALQYTPKLRELDMVLYGGDEVDLGCFSHLKHLKSLFISGGDISDIDMVNTDALIGLPELLSLSFHEFGKVDLKFLDKMPALEEFMCGWGNEVKNLDSIRSLKRLKSLSLFSIRMHDIGFLDSFPDSLRLEMSGTIDSAIDIEMLNRFTARNIFEVTADGKGFPDSRFCRKQ